MMTIIFYDIPSTLAGNAWSPNTWKTRYALNFKGIPYKTEWIEYPDIQAHCLKLGILPTAKRVGGSPYYSLPAIHNTETGEYVADSWDIAVYLDKTFPDTPKLFPNNTIALQNTFSSAYYTSIDALWDFILPQVVLILNPPSAEYFRRTREKSFGKPMEEVVPKGEAAIKEWTKYKDGLGKVDSWYAKSSGPFLLGDTPSWGDFVVASFLVWPRIVWGENSEQWKDIASWHEGRWKNLISNLQKYETLH